MVIIVFVKMNKTRNELTRKSDDKGLKYKFIRN
jgi:hypothetical protein